ncbi:hypothetical protein B0H16DRAFT_637208 [Mycena metata]|nr:hypothetical protein B0H16DRAFT_637208 [Mycena metata]
MVVKRHPNCEVELPVNVALLPLLYIRDPFFSWISDQPDGAPSDPSIDPRLAGDLMPDSWTRYNLHQILVIAAIHRDLSFECAELWLSQANHIFSSLQIRCNHNQYGVCMNLILPLPLTMHVEVVIDWVRFTRVFSPTTRSSCPSQGWLFLCPDAQLRSGPCSFRWPDCAAYWSRDPFGAVRLSPEEAEEAGFPLITLELRVWGDSWDSIDYAELWRFHQAKGFAPDSQEIARHLGHPLYQLCDEVAVETPFAHVTGGGIEEDNTDQHDATNATMSDERVYETVDSEHGDEDEKFEGLQADILLPSRGVRFLSKLPAVILALVVLCCLSYTTY